MSGEEAGGALHSLLFSSQPQPAQLMLPPQNFLRVTREHLELGEEVYRWGGGVKFKWRPLPTSIAPGVWAPPAFTGE